VMFFSFSSAMVMIHLNPCTKGVFVSDCGRFLKEGIPGRHLVQRRRADRAA
jgi:hypothetical protein